MKPMSKIQLKEMPLDIGKLNHLYEQVNQSCCLVQVQTPLAEEKAKQYIDAMESGKVGDKAFLCRGIYSDDTLIGKIEVSRYEDGSAELDLILREEDTQKGYGKEALEKLEEMILEEHWCHEIVAYVKDDNVAMRKLLEGNGYEAERPFKADIMVPRDGKYQLQEIQGFEYRKVLVKSI